MATNPLKLNFVKDKAMYVLLSAYAVLAVLTIVLFDGTSGSGDSALHYLFARYAPSHPELYFNHWAKPLFVLLASPFAQFGFVGMKVFNALAFGISIFLTCKVCRLLGVKNAILTVPFMVFAPMCYVLVFSGLTEPLFALFLIWGIYLATGRKHVLACLVISFLPFVRSEGLMIIGVFGLYYLLKRQWTYIPLLLAGHVVYSLAGYFVYNDLLWAFTRIPYANLGSPYGSGTLFHFVQQLLYVVGIPLYILFWLGLVSLVWKTYKRKIALEGSVLVLLGFVVFFVAHTLFWYLGIFNSMGLVRVLLGVLPLIAVFCLEGFNLLLLGAAFLGKKIQWGVGICFLLYILVFPFTSNPAAMKLPDDLLLNADQLAAIRAAGFIEKMPRTEGGKFVYSNPYLGIALDMDHFDDGQRKDLTMPNIAQLKKGDVVIWENWYAVVEHGIGIGELEKVSGLKEVYHSEVTDNDREIQYRVFEKQ